MVGIILTHQTSVNFAHLHLLTASAAPQPPYVLNAQSRIISVRILLAYYALQQ